ncbi:MAG: hypothetical protein ABIY55_29370 [Kofleriaceae bacterium]
MKRKQTRLVVARETLRVLRDASLRDVAAGVNSGPTEVADNGCGIITKLNKGDNG